MAAPVTAVLVGAVDVSVSVVVNLVLAVGARSGCAVVAGLTPCSATVAAASGVVIIAAVAATVLAAAPLAAVFVGAVDVS